VTTFRPRARDSCSPTSSSREWSARGAEFLTPPKDHGSEIRCYLRDPDGHLIEVGQSTGVLDQL
jgi:catechol 2,3-dioxygenase-like lactoylglutathione lyase family enzyme